MHGLVSILIPVFNHAEGLKRCIDSCLNQDYSNIEIIVLNDASTEGDFSFIKTLESVKVKYHLAPKQQGIAASRNQLLTLATGEFIAWIDADDYMLNNRISKQVNYLNLHPNCDLVGSFMLENRDSKTLYKCPTQHEAIKACLTYKNCLFQPSVLSRNFYKEEKILYNNRFGNIAEDYDLWSRLIKQKQFANLPVALTVYAHPSPEALDFKRDLFDFETKSLWIHQSLWAKAELTTIQKDLLNKAIYYPEKLNDLELAKSIEGLKRLRSVMPNRHDKTANGFYMLWLWSKLSPWFKVKHIGLIAHCIDYLRYKTWFRPIA